MNLLNFSFLIFLALPCFLCMTMALPVDEQKAAAMSRQELRMRAEARVAAINKSGRGWTAKLHSKLAELTKEEIKRQFLGLAMKPRKRQQKLLAKTVEALELHTNTAGKRKKPSFDARKEWPECANVIGKIQDQSGCGSCWAVSSASVMQDRICIQSNGTKKVDISAKDLLACEPSSFGCDGGFPDMAFEFWQSDGVVTGSDYSVKKGCKPYPFPPHSRKQYRTPKCRQHCDSWRNWFKYKKDKHFGLDSTSLVDSDQHHIMEAILQGGPVVAGMVVYDDFIHYSSGVYEHGEDAEELGGHAVRVIGWGVDEQSGKPYWLVANSWNSDWGTDGYFKIARGQDECFFESWLIAFADPKL